MTYDDSTIHLLGAAGETLCGLDTDEVSQCAEFFDNDLGDYCPDCMGELSQIIAEYRQLS